MGTIWQKEGFLSRDRAWCQSIEKVCSWILGAINVGTFFLAGARFDKQFKGSVLS
jgi:hypothetical protein